MRKRELTDWKRNNKIALRNFSKNCDFHDIVKCLFVRMLRRNHKDNGSYPIYTEYDPLKPNKEYPDIWMKLKKDIYVFELQDKITKKWLKQIIKKYENVNLIVIDLQKIFKEWIESKEKPLESLRKILEDYII
ncbi:MAG: hypothetical protein ACTSUC_09695 [Promethearchaeota archaeon]